MAKFDAHEAITATIIEKLEEGTKPWSMPFQGGSLQFPHRTNGEPYRGINVLLLWIAAEKRRFTGRTWMTFKQAKALGANVKKGAKSTPIIFFKKVQVTDRKDPEGDKITVPCLRTYNVFNSDQIEGLPERFASPAIVPAQGMERDREAEETLKSCGATICEGGAGAYYDPAADVVTMPDFERFKSSSGYLATLAHELCHWTGHKSRLDRFGDNDKTSYAFEELVAEIGAAFVGAQLGIVGEHIDNHA